MGNCSTCKYWPLNTQLLHSGGTSPFEPSRHEADGVKYGVCDAIGMLPDWKRTSGLPKAYVQDGSDYSAELVTSGSFSCSEYVFGEPKRIIVEEDLVVGRRFSSRYPQSPDWFFVGKIYTRDRPKEFSEYSWLCFSVGAMANRAKCDEILSNLRSPHLVDGKYVDGVMIRAERVGSINSYIKLKDE